MITKRKITDYIGIVANTAQTSHYELSFDGLSEGLRRFLSSKNVDRAFVLRNAGLLCSNASLPGSQLATTETRGNFMGVIEPMVHSRIFTTINLDFYVDKQYKMLKFMEHWMDYVSNGSENSGVTKDQDGYYYRMRYPKDAANGYKCDKIKLVKFDRDYKDSIEYTFYEMFPRNISSVPVQYGSSDTLKMSVEFAYTRYICGKSTSLSRQFGNNENFTSSLLRLLT